MGAMRRVIKNPNVTAGLKCPPEMCPTAEAMTAITNPCANATPTRPEPVMIAPAPTNVSAKAPTSSAALRRKTSPSTPAEGRVTAGRLLHVQSASSATHRQKMRHRAILPYELHEGPRNAISCPCGRPKERGGHSRGHDVGVRAGPGR